MNSFLPFSPKVRSVGGGVFMLCDVVTARAWCRPGEERQKSGGLVPGIGSIRHTSHSHQAAAQLGAAGAIELGTKLREDFTISEKAPTRALSWLKAPTHLLRHYLDT